MMLSAVLRDLPNNSDLFVLFVFMCFVLARALSVFVCYLRFVLFCVGILCFVFGFVGYCLTLFDFLYFLTKPTQIIEIQI